MINTQTQWIKIVNTDNSVRFLFKTIFISEQIAENRFGDLLEISDKFITKFNVFRYMILHFRFKIVWKF